LSSLKRRLKGLRKNNLDNLALPQLRGFHNTAACKMHSL
jgi:hypothetical protein